MLRFRRFNEHIYYLKYKPGFIMQNVHVLLFYCIFSLLRVILKAFVIAVTTYESMLISYSEVDIIQNMNNLLRAKPTVLPITTSQPLNVK